MIASGGLLRGNLRTDLIRLGGRTGIAWRGDPLSATRPTCRPAQAGKCVANSCQGSATSDQKSKLFEDLADATEYYKSVPPSERYKASADVLTAMKALKAAGEVKKWGKIMEDRPQRRNVFLGDLKKMGIKEPSAVAIPSVRDDKAFLFTLVGATSVIAVLGGLLPGDWGFFVPYLSGGVVLVVLAIGSTAPGLLQVFTNFFKTAFPDFRERVLRHEASHFLIGYLLGVPITSYSLSIGKEHIDFAEAFLQNRRLIERKLTDQEVDQLAIMSMAGVSAESMTFEEVIGQTQDLMDLQRILKRSETRLGDQAQQNMTRWAVFQAASALNKHQREYDALMAAMQAKRSVAECIKAIESA